MTSAGGRRTRVGTDPATERSIRKAKILFRGRQVTSGALRGRVVRILAACSSRLFRAGARPDQSNGALAVPQRAVMGCRQLSGSSGGRGEQISIRSNGDRFGNMWIVEEGLKARRTGHVEAPESEGRHGCSSKALPSTGICKKGMNLIGAAQLSPILYHVQILH
jgi:hypothetical protein